MLPLPYVEKIHRLLQIRYGSRWVSLWVGIEQRDIQADWAQQLDGMSPDGIKYALANLPADFPPTATAFRALGNRRPDPVVLALPPLPSSPEKARKIAAAVRMMSGKPTPAEHMAGLWARLDSGEPMSAAMRDFLGRAERSYSHTISLPGDFTPIPAHALPPGMRGEPAPALADEVMA
jgi:hypothetical protein